jgi:hypothetical protein
MRWGWLVSYSLVTTVEPAVEPLLRVDVKTHLRIDHTTEDTLVDSLIAAARRQVEKETGRRLVTQTLSLGLADFPRIWPWAIAPGAEPARKFVFPGRFVHGVIDLPVEPVQSVTSVKYYDPDGVQQTMTPTTDYLTWLAYSPPVVYTAPGSYWPLTQVGRLDTVEVVFVAGYGDASVVPAEVKAAMLLTIAYWFENRGDGPDPAEKGLPPAALRLLRSLDTGSYS